MTALSPQQAADRAKVSRGTIMNAIKDKSLIADRNNQNWWKIDPKNLSKWMADRSVTISDNSTDKADNTKTQIAPSFDEKSIQIAVLNAEARVKDQRILDLEGDRNSWRDQAQQLAQQLAQRNKLRRWWPFG